MYSTVGRERITDLFLWAMYRDSVQMDRWTLFPRRFLFPFQPPLQPPRPHISGAALGIQIDGAKNFVQNEIRKIGTKPY